MSLRNFEAFVIHAGTHNHDVQSRYQQNFINPLKVCPELRDMVDDKLFAGVNQPGQVASAVRDAVQERFRYGKRTMDLSRLWYLATRLTTQVVKNRRTMLGLGTCDGFRMDSNDTTSVWKLVDLWQNDPTKDTPV